MAAEITPSAALKQSTAELWISKIGEGGAGSLSILDASNVVLATFTLPNPCGVHTDGKLVFSSIANSIAAATGVANSAVFKNGSGATVLTTNVSSSSGTAFCRLSNTSLVADGPLSVTSCEIQF